MHYKKVLSLLNPVRLGALLLRNRIVMAPMTRSRADISGDPNDLMVTYYRQRASAGMIISEGIYPSFSGQGYARTPGLVTASHVAGWKQVTDAVHAEGGLMVAQLMHCGRIAHAANKHDKTVAPSAFRAQGQMYTDAHGMQPFDEPQELSDKEVRNLIADYGRATALAMEAGFDGVELHGTSGYLPVQFLCVGPNRRDDAWGGSLENRIRFPREVLRAMSEAAGADRVGLRICPGNPFNDLHDDDPETTFTGLLQALRGAGLAYLHVMRRPGADLDNIALARRHFDGSLLLNESFSLAEASEAIGAGEGEAVSFARLFVSNPDLVQRAEAGGELASFDRRTLYTPGPQGYTDY
jgi:N-ethylmaleimide reductase